MRDFFSYFAEASDAPWLLLGKGPSFSKLSQFDISSFRTLTLNHAVREFQPNVAHVIDLDVIDQCSDALRAGRTKLVMPWVPHVNNRPSHATLGELVKTHPVLEALESEGRLLWYNLSTAGRPNGSSPVIPVRFFSAEAALSLLATAGARVVRSLGVDGGSSYSRSFADLNDRTLLANGRSSFDRQFEQIAAVIATTGVDYAPLDMQAPINVYVATTEAQMLPTRVLEYSIRQHASVTTKVHPLSEFSAAIPLPRDQRNRPRTPFSFQRFLIPSIQQFSGRAIYLDSDMQVFKDIRDLWSRPFDGADVLCVAEPNSTGRKPQFSVMLLDCERLSWDIGKLVESMDAGRLTYEQLMYELGLGVRVSASLEPTWNSLERFSEGETALVHYTDMNTQPWVSRQNPLGYLWCGTLLEAVERGAISSAQIREDVEKGYVRPSLLFQVERGIADPLLLPKEGIQLDANFHAPYLDIASKGVSGYRSNWLRLRAYARHLYRTGPAHALHQRLRERLKR